MTTGPSPTMRRRQLGMELRRLREANGRSLDDVARAVGRVPSTISRIETGKVGLRPTLVRALLDVYAVPEGAEREALLELARDAQRKGWWNEYDDVLSARTDFERYLGYEGGAASLRVYENRMVPGLLQTSDYARASLRAVRVYDDPDDLERLVELRIKRQELLTRRDPMVVWAVLDEAVLRRPVGGAEILRAQLESLLTVGQLPNVAIQVLPFARGAHAGLDGSFTIIEFPDVSDPDVVYLDGPAGNLYIEKVKDVRRHAGVFNRLLSEALTREETADFIRAVIDGSPS